MMALSWGGGFGYASKCHCEEDEDFVGLLKARQMAWEMSRLSNKPPWWESINHKIGAYVFARAVGVKAPKTLACFSLKSTADGTRKWTRTENLKRVKQIIASLKQIDRETNSSFVVKPMHGMSAVGVFIVNGKSIQAVADLTPGSSQGQAKRSFVSIAWEMISSASSKKKIAHWTVESLVKPRTVGKVEDYKFLVFGGNIATVDYILRSTTGGCNMISDAAYTTRYDFHNCLSGHNTGNASRPYCSSRKEKRSYPRCTPRQMEGTAIHDGSLEHPVIKTKFAATKIGATRAKVDTSPAKLDAAAAKIWKDAIASVRLLGKAVGVHMRIDLIMGVDGVYLGEFTPFHRNGKQDCAAFDKTDGNTDMCFLGRIWKESYAQEKVTTLFEGLTPKIELPKVEGVDFVEVYQDPTIMAINDPDKFRLMCAGNLMSPRFFHLI